ncbi:RINT-1 family protein [Talaromyces proteolyticus]|uniref:RINT-1 family protein n=1 Tax=Talaromyces proteolyticus TaxID=1131652 RepID=A0AAD4KNT2_9EURO|nr:RINT-1 family protein [Talaromyces proteolyticus]KAH8692676.1 RINT-1 family protein [Talaromyces proteolyticus]
MTASLDRLSSQEAARVQDYLNDKIQSLADLEGLDSLLSNLRAQHELQRKQLAEAQQALEKATTASKNHRDAVRTQAEAFNRQQEDIDQRLKIITQSETSDEAVRLFQLSMNKLQRLDVAKGYLSLLHEAEGLSDHVSKSIQSAPHQALPSYKRLRAILSSLNDAQVAAEGAAPHLVDHIEKLTTSVKKQIQENFNNRLQKTLEKLRWPGKDLVLNNGFLREWEASVDLLLDFQEPDLCVSDPSAIEHGEEAQVLLPLEVMVHPLQLRFKYHFSGTKPTNRLDKPEYFLSHVSDLISAHAGFFATYLQPILARRAGSAADGLKWNFSSATNAFITALLPMIRQKISGFVPQVATNPQLLSHFMHELMTFDTDLRETWNYLPNSYSTETWKGLASEVLTQQNWFDRWLQVEKEFALSRYKDIIDTPESGHIDYDGVESNATKPTNAAIRVNDLLETITERYKPLSSFSHKLRFLIEIQITIFDQFHERLHSGLEAYLAMTSTIGRTVQGGDQGGLEGVSALERLCRIFGSAEYLEKKMQDWSDDVFFLDLWYELQDRVQKSKDDGKNVVGPMSVAEVAQRTSQAVADNHLTHRSNMSEGALFDETASAYRRLRMRSESIIVSTFSSEVQNSLKLYSRVSTWSSLSSPSASFPHPLTSELTSAIRILSSNISFLARALGTAALRRITRQVLLSTQGFIWDNVILRHSFSAAGASQLASDVHHVCGVVDSALSSQAASQGESRRTIRKLTEGLTLLSLKIKPQNVTSKSEEEQTDKNEELGLWEVERRLFANNESARQVLNELDIETLTEAEARSVLEKRVEIRS